MNLGILCGGNSSERAVSFESTLNVYNAVKKSYNPVLIDAGRGEVFTDIKKQEEKPSLGWDINLVQKILSILNEKNIDFIIVMLHGNYGEDGHVQALLDMCNIPYTGSNMGASYLGMNKEISKYLMEYFKIPTPEAVFIDKDYDLMNIKNSLELPVIVKPISEGSTIGISIVQDEKNLENAIEKGFKYGSKLIIEKYIDGEEMTLTVMDNKTYPVVKIIPSTGFYDYERKYGDGQSKYECPADLSKKIKNKVNEDALLLYEKMDLSGAVRFDFLYNKETCKYYFLEVNTIPGMTEHSLVPMAFNAENINFKQLMDKIINNGFEKDKDEK